MAYNTEQKIFETLELAEQCGVNTVTESSKIRRTSMSANDPQRPRHLSSDQGCDRRRFLEAAAAIPAALAAAQVWSDVSAAERPASPGAAKMPHVMLGGHSISRLIVGCHDIDAGSHLGPIHNAAASEFYTLEQAVKAIQQTKRSCLAFKILAGGRRYDIERAFRETFAGIKPTDAVVVGIYDRYSDQAGQNADLVRRLGSRS